MLPADAVLWSPGRVSVGADVMCVRCVNEMNEKMQERDETEGALPTLVCVVCVLQFSKLSHMQHRKLLTCRVKHPISFCSAIVSTILPFTYIRSK